MEALTRKLFWLSFWVVGFAVSMTGLLLYFKYQGVITGLQRDRVLMVAVELDDIAEKDLSLGQDFWGIATLQEVLERRRSADPLFVGIDVAGKDGKIAYSTDISRVGSALPAQWTQAFDRSAGTTSLSPSQELAIVASPIRNAFDEVAGYTVIRYGREREHEAMASFARKLLLTGSEVFAGFTLMLFAVLQVSRKRMERTLSRAAAAAAGRGDPPRPLAGELGVIAAELREADRLIAAVRPEPAN